MNGARHTPGPWQASEEGAVVALRSGASVAQVYGRARSELVANRRLVEMAPDLKSALALALRALESVTAPTPLQLQAAREARAALVLVRP